MKGAGGERFAHFMDRLIRAEAARGGLAQSEIQVQPCVNIKDGGVYTEVKQPIPGDLTGWFGVPTCWQFKAREGTDIDDKPKKKKHNELQEEIRKPYVKELIAKGYGYRLCILGDLSPPKVSEWESQLEAEAHSINPSAPDPRVVHGGHLVAWGERFPAVIAWLRGWAEGGLHWEAWGKSCRSVTSHYVSNPEWDGIRQQIRQHVDFQSSCVGGDPCLTIGGAAGVGKTRLVFETLNESPASPSLVVYALDEREAGKIASEIANTDEQTALLVADECTAQTRHRLNEMLRGCVARIRVVCIDNAGERLASKASQLWLSADELKNTDAILEANYPHVPADRRHQYAQFSRGFVRMAADMCDRDVELAGGDFSGLLGKVEPYVKHRLQEHCSLISLLGLFRRVGFRDDAHGDLEALCKLANRQPQDFHAAVRAVRDSPGFVVQAGRFWYVTPEIVARVLFAEGWERWVVHDPAVFLKQLPDHLGQQLIDRAGKLGEEEVRDQIASFFRQWFDQLTATDLAVRQVASLAEAIVEASPEEFLPRLRVVLDHAAEGELLQIQGHAHGAKWGPRRTLVWLLERLVSFSEFFADCEACLFRLALHETELQIGNNATRIWEALFSVYLSGTAAPFAGRVEVLRIRTFSSDPNAAELGFKGVTRPLEMVSGGVVGPPVVAGRLRPQDWEPQSGDEELGCYRAILGLCDEHLRGASTEQRRLAFDVLAGQASFILSHGLCDELQEILKPERLSDEEVRRLLNEVDEFLKFEEETGRWKTNEKAYGYIHKVRDWIDTFRPLDFDGRLRSLSSRDPWDRRFTEDPQTETDETDEFALQIIHEPTRLHPHLDWLATPEARSAERLGFTLGRRDESFACGGMIFEHAIARGAAPLLRGYVRGLASSSRPPTRDLLHLADRLRWAEWEDREHAERFLPS